MRHLAPIWLIVLVVAVPPLIAQPSLDLPADAERRIDEILAKMTVEEKVGQMSLRGNGSSSTRDPMELTEVVRAGRAGALLNVMDVAVVDHLQKVAVEESRLGIPLLFARDVIHGFRTVFPIPLGQAASWDPEMVEVGARIAAVEASTFGLRWTFAPMVDIARDPRWGRIAESLGEDPYLAGVLAAAMVRGFQGDDLTSKTSLAACVKHFAGYGAAEGGRDYNTTYIPEPLLRNVYLPPFETAVEAGALTLMSGFNEINGIPASAHELILSTILRDEWGFRGFVVSDWNSVTEMIPHGYSRDEAQAAAQASVAGLDMEMVSESYDAHLPAAIRDGKVPMAAIDAAARNVLRVKLALGLFEDPYRDASRRPEDVLLAEAHLEAARDAARRSAVLLENNGVLPLAADVGRVAVVGPLADAPHEQLGTWTFDGKSDDSVTPLTALKDKLGERVSWAPGLEVSRTRSQDGFAAAVAAAESADVVLFFAGEEAILSGEAHSRADLRLPGAQQDLIRELAATGKPIVLVILAGRPITFGEIIDDVDAVLISWHPGTMGGPALVDLLFGDVSPSGRLPVTWPKEVGQVPIYYNHKNTGRPAPDELIAFDDIPVGAWQSSLSNTSHYLDLGKAPQYPFGYGLTYSSFAYSDLKISAESIAMDGEIEISATVVNTGEREATEVAQLYTRDMFGSLTRPVRELKGFEHITLAPGEERRLTFRLAAHDLAFYGPDNQRRVEPGAFGVWIGPNAAEGLEGRFEVHGQESR